MKREFDVVVIGAGPAGEIAPARANRAPGGAGLVEDYLGPHAHADPALPN